MPMLFLHADGTFNLLVRFQARKMEKSPKAKGAAKSKTKG